MEILLLALLFFATGCTAGFMAARLHPRRKKLLEGDRTSALRAYQDMKNGR